MVAGIFAAARRGLGPGIWGEVLAGGVWGIALLPGTPWTEMYQEISGEAATTLCAPGDPVGTIRDLISGRSIVMASDTARPVYQAAAGLHWLDSDGLASVMTAVMPTYAGAMLYGIAAHRRRSGFNRTISVGKGTEQDWNSNARVELIGRGGSGFGLYRNGVDIRGGNPANNVDFVFESFSDDTRSHVAMNGASDTALTHASLGAFDLNRIGFLSQSSGVASTDGRLYAALVAGAEPTVAQRAELVAAAAALCGVVIP